MKKLFATALFAATMLFSANSAQAQVKFGLKGGFNVTSMSLSSEVLDASNRAGFFIGPTVKFTLPVVGLGVDVSALYDQRESKVKVDDYETESTLKAKAINIPINLRYGFGLGSTASLYLFAGPQFGFNVGDKNFDWTKEASYRLKSTNFSVNLGAGVTVINHLEVGFNYNIACGKTGEASVKNVLDNTWEQVSKGRSNAWQISLAYYF